MMRRYVGCVGLLLATLLTAFRGDAADQAMATADSAADWASPPQKKDADNKTRAASWIVCFSSP